MTKLPTPNKVPNRPKVFESRPSDPAIANALWSSKFPDEDQKMIFETTIKRAKGLISDPEWDKFIQMLKHAVKS